MAVREEFQAEGVNAPLSHYTDAVRYGDLVYISGCGPVDEHLNLVGGDDPAAQTRQVLLNMQKILDSVGAGFEDILKVTVYLTDIADLKAINPVRQEFFGSARPASTLIEISRLAVDRMRVEIDAVAGLPKGDRRRSNGDASA